MDLLIATLKQLSQWHPVTQVIIIIVLSFKIADYISIYCSTAVGRCGEEVRPISCWCQPSDELTPHDDRVLPSGTHKCR